MLAVYLGPMCAGKSRKLILSLQAARAAGRATVAVKHTVDTRAAALASRSGLTHAADVVATSLDDVPVAAGCLYGIDDAQFFGPTLLPFWARVRAAGSSLAVAGLDLDYARRPFGQLLDLAAAGLAPAAGHSVVVERLTAECEWAGAGATGPCPQPAVFSQRLHAPGVGAQQVAVGGAELYAPSCEAHHVPQPVAAEHWRGRGRGGGGGRAGSFSGAAGMR